MSDLLSDSLRVHIHRFPSCRRFPSVPRLSPIVYHVQNDLALCHGATSTSVWPDAQLLKSATVDFVKSRYRYDHKGI